MDRNTKKVGKHYQLPLPLKNHTKFSNNRKDFSTGDLSRTLNSLWIIKVLWMISSRKVIQRSQPKKFQKEEHGIFHTMECTTRANLGRSGWYSTEVLNSSLNKNLMSGPDLTNKILGVLTRFLGEPVVIMGDIEPMFHQVMVPREDRSLLRLL